VPRSCGAVLFRTGALTLIASAMKPAHGDDVTARPPIERPAGRRPRRGRGCQGSRATAADAAGNLRHRMQRRAMGNLEYGERRFAVERVHITIPVGCIREISCR